MGNFNKVFLMGNLTRDPEVRATAGGQSVTALGLAVNRTFYVGGQGGQGGEKREETTFVDVDFWGRRGEAIAQYLHKGDPIFIEGRLTFRTWDDKDGNKRSKLSVTGEDFQFVSGRRGEGGGSGGGSPRAAGGNRPAPAQSESGGFDGGDADVGFDEVPF